MNEKEIERLIVDNIIVDGCECGNVLEITASTAAHAIAEKMAEGVVYEEELVAKYISTPSLDCNWLELKRGLFDGAKIPIDAASGTLLDGQRFRVTVKRRSDADS